MREWITIKFSPWKVGDKVWLEMMNLHMGGPKKRQNKRTSLFEIEKVVFCMAFHLWIPSHWKIHPVFHTLLLTSYKETVEHSPDYLWLPPDLIDGEEEYEVKVVLGHQGKPGCCIFPTWWKGYSTAEDAWELEWNLGNTQPLIIAYRIGHPKEFPEYNHHHKLPKWWMPFSMPLSSLFFLFRFSSASSAMCSGIHSIQTQESPWDSLGEHTSLSHLKYGTLLPTGRRCEGSLITAQTKTILPQAGKDIRCSNRHLLPHLQCPLYFQSPPMKSLSMSSDFPSPNEKWSLPTSSCIPTSYWLLHRPTPSRRTLYYPSLSPSSTTTPWSVSCMHALLSLIYPLRSVRPLMLSCPLPKAPSLSCWWTGDLTKVWRSSLEPNSVWFSALLSSPSQSRHGRHIMMNQWKYLPECQIENRRRKRLRIPLLLTHNPDPTPIPLPHHILPLPPAPSPPIPPPAPEHPLPRWSIKWVLSQVPWGPIWASLLRSTIKETWCQHREDEEELPYGALQQWILDELLCLED